MNGWEEPDVSARDCWVGGISAVKVSTMIVYSTVSVREHNQQTHEITVNLSVKNSVCNKPIVYFYVAIYIALYINLPWKYSYDYKVVFLVNKKIDGLMQ